MPAALVVKNLSKRYRLGEVHAPASLSLKAHLESWIRGQSVAVRHGQRAQELRALHNVSFNLRRGELLGVIGRNGAGKSTLLKCIARLTYPSDGTITAYGQVGTLFSIGCSIHPELTGRENIFTIGALMGMPRKTIHWQYDAIVAFSELEQFMETPVKFYSAGMQGRLAFAVAVHLDLPDILLIDEVLASGDLPFKKKCIAKLKEIILSERSVIFATHNLEFLRQHATRVLYMRAGKIVARGQPDDVVNTYIEDIAPSPRSTAPLVASPAPVPILA